MKVASVLAFLALAAPASAATPLTVQDKLVKFAMAEARRNVQEIPARSNLGPDIKRYHRAVKHASADQVWCTIFVSWVARKAGYPLGSVGQGVWDVQRLFEWGREEGFYFRKGTRRVRPGDIAMHGYGHAGIVAKVTKDGQIYTVDGNWSDTVRYQPLPYLSLSGYIRLPSTPRTP
jgi:hypothetical protein